MKNLIKEIEEYGLDKEKTDFLKSLNQDKDSVREVFTACKNNLPFEIVKFIAKPCFNWFQKREIRYAVEDLMSKNLSDADSIFKKIELFAKSEYSGMQMRILRWAIINNKINLDFVKKNLLNPDLKPDRMNEIRKNCLKRKKNGVKPKY